jgi:tRNA A-37 threonylcarbamoyl transferase component Bud32
VVFGALGFAVYRLKSNSRSSWGFLAFCVVVSIFWMIRSVPQFYRVPVESSGFYLLQCALPLATLCFLGTFSPLRVVLTPLRPWLLAAAALGLMLLTVNQIAYPRDAAAGLLSLPLLVSLSAMMLTIMLLSQPTRLWFYLRGLPIGQTDRARATSLRFAVVLGFVPLAVFYPAVVAGRIDYSQRLWFELAVLAFPLIVAYAIVRHNLLQLNELAREGLAIGLLVLSLGLAYAIVAALVGPLAQRVLGEASGALPQSIAVGVFAFALMPLYAATRRRLLHRYHRADSFDEYLQMLSTLSDRQRNLDTFCDEAVLIASAALNGNSVALLLRQKSAAGEWRLAASTADTPLSIDLERFRPVLESLRQTSVTLDQNEILEGRAYRLQRGTLLKAWSDLNASMVVPLHGGGNRLVAALVLGRKPAGATFTARELRFIEALHARLATGLARWFTEADEASTATARYPAYPPTIGRYRLDRLLGEGATCYVYLAFDGKREVAIKVPKPRTLASDTLLARFLRESRTMRRVVHRHVVRVLDEGTARGEPFIVVEYFPEGAFNRYLKRVGSIDEARALGFIRDLASGLEAALEHDIIHRDIKPANFFLTAGEQVKIGDFGLAKGADDTTLTVLGAFLGTPAYVSPEVANGFEASWRADQYSLGICLFEMLAGERPFQSASIDDLLHLHRTEPIPDLCQRSGVSSTTQSVLRRMTEKAPADRFQSYAQLRDALQVAIGSQDLVA